jgi:hypothetical protein
VDARERKMDNYFNQSIEDNAIGFTGSDESRLQYNENYQGDPFDPAFNVSPPQNPGSSGGKED